MSYKHTSTNKARQRRKRKKFFFVRRLSIVFKIQIIKVTYLNTLEDIQVQLRVSWKLSIIRTQYFTYIERDRFTILLRKYVKIKVVRFVSFVCCSLLLETRILRRKKSSSLTTLSFHFVAVVHKRTSRSNKPIVSNTLLRESHAKRNGTLNRSKHGGLGLFNLGTYVRWRFIARFGVYYTLLNSRITTVEVVSGTPASPWCVRY